MTVIKEGNLEFDFGDAWAVYKYDENGGFYKTKLEKNIKPTMAVDFLCLRDGRPLLILEAKDYAKGVPPKEKFDKLPMAIAIKVRDTIAGIVGGSHRAGRERGFFRNSHQRLAKPPWVVCFFEDMCTPARRLPQRRENKKDVLLKQMRKHLSWLTDAIAVVDLDDYDKFIDDLTVRRI